jgi:hypothetical protein
MSSNDDRPDKPPAIEPETTSATDADDFPHFEGVAVPERTEPWPHFVGSLKPPGESKWFGLRRSKRGRNER